MDMKLGFDSGIKIGDFGMMEATISSSDDPIGDALRSDCMAYWKMDELDGSGPWADATSHNYTLTNPGDNFMESVVGKIGNSAGYTDSTTLFAQMQSDVIGTFLAWSIQFWLKMNATAGIGNTANLVSLPNSLNLDFDGDTSLYIHIFPPAVSSAHYVISASEWHHVAVSSDGTNHKIYIDNVLKETIVGELLAEAFGITLLLTAGWNDTDYLYVDEVGFFDVVITSEQISYLYNFGNGRTLYP